MAPKVNFKINGLVSLSQKAVQATAEAIYRRADEIIATPGYFDSTPRDIIDQGKLRKGQRLIKINANQYAIKNGVEHATYVANGYSTRSGRRIEGRDWNKAAADEVLRAGVFANEVRSRIK